MGTENEEPIQVQRGTNVVPMLNRQDRVKFQEMIDEATKDLWTAVRAAEFMLRRARERFGLPEL